MGKEESDETRECWVRDDKLADGLARKNGGNVVGGCAGEGDERMRSSVSFLF